MRNFKKITIVISIIILISSLVMYILVGTTLSPKIKNSYPISIVKTSLKSRMNDLKRFINRVHRSIDSNKMIVYKPNENSLELYSLMSDGNILVTKFSKKAWGTWNIEGWLFAEDGAIPTKSPQSMVGGGSDWEYVFRVAENPDTAYKFSGGNHGKERLKNIKLINGENNDEIHLHIGEKISLRTLKIIEETCLTSDDELIKDYANVQRIYTIRPSKIDFSAEFKFVSDIYMGTSYVCMLPASKKYGRYAKFEESDNIYITPNVGETLTTSTFENYLGKEKTLSVEIWGDVKPEYKFRTWIQNEKMADNFKNKLKVFYWDLNKMGNKLYFSKFDNEDHKKVSAGTVWKNIQGWEFCIK